MSAIVILPWFPIDYSPLKEWDKIEARRVGYQELSPIPILSETLR